MSYLRTVLLISVSMGCASPPPEPDASSPVAVEFSRQWEEIEPGGSTGCADGSDYRFWLRRGDPDNLLVYFEGGGACWSASTCDLERGTFDPNVGVEDHPDQQSGIFELEHPENPLADFSMVFIPYCTGDVHLGDRRQAYAREGDSAEELVIEHRGWNNAIAGVQQAVTEFPNPKLVFVAGSSAGSIASPFYAGILAERYAAAEIVQLGDASGAYRTDDWSPYLEAWGLDEVVLPTPAFAEVSAADLSFAELYIRPGQRYADRLRMAQIDTHADRIQAFFLAQSQIENPGIAVLLAANRKEIRSELESFRSFTSGGRDHTILDKSFFYSFAADGTRARDWTAAHLAGDQIFDVECRQCGWPELYLQADDRAILDRTSDLLADPDAWHQNDDRLCEDDEADDRRSLYCALRRASDDVLGEYDHRRAALQAIRYEIERSTGKFDWEHRLKDYNNRPETRLEDVQELIRSAGGEIDLRTDP